MSFRLHVLGSKHACNTKNTGCPEETSSYLRKPFPRKILYLNHLTMCTHYIRYVYYDCVICGMTRQVNAEGQRIRRPPALLRFSRASTLHHRRANNRAPRVPDRDRSRLSFDTHTRRESTVLLILTSHFPTCIFMSFNCH